MTRKSQTRGLSALMSGRESWSCWPHHAPLHALDTAWPASSPLGGDASTYLNGRKVKEAVKNDFFLERLLYHDETQTRECVIMMKYDSLSYHTLNRT